MPLASLIIGIAACTSLQAAELPPPAAQAVDFERHVAPIFAARCLACHGPEKQKSGFRLDVKTIALNGGESSAPNIKPGDSATSPLVRYIAGLEPDMQMPPKGARLSDAEIGVIRRWIDDGAEWPVTASVQVANPLDWWSLKPIVKPAVPGAGANPIDAFVSAKLAENALAMSPEADARTLCRRVYFDLIGLPPTADEIDAYAADPAADRYERLVDRLLASPRYGERWARHWLDVVHYADTHGYDKDKPRDHAWPYRDYVIRALNDDKPYARFVEEQLAGDALYPNTSDGVEALGFIAAGPWDFIGHAEVSEDKIDGKFARHFDRDDMVGNAIGTFASVTVQCAQCHNHKFDPVTQDDYYALQAVFAAVDRADKAFDADPAIAAQRAALTAARAKATAELARIDSAFAKSAGDELLALDRAIAAASKPMGANAPEFGYHSEIALDAHAGKKWVQVDLGRSVALDAIVLAPCHDDFNGIGDGFGFPRAFRIEASDDAGFNAADPSSVRTIAVRNEGEAGAASIAPQRFDAKGTVARYIRVTATTLAPRKDDFIFALAELEAIDATQRNIALGAAVTSADSIEYAERWRRVNLTDGIYPAANADAKLVDQRARELDMLKAQRIALRDRVLDATSRDARANADAELAHATQTLAALPAPELVYAGTVFTGSGTFVGTGANGGRPREIRVLARGQVTAPGKVVEPAALAALAPLLPAKFDNISPSDGESARRAALAHWLTDPRNPLTWRSIVNRVWQYHFGRAIADTPNDFGRMGARPTQPELLDWLAATFRDDMRGSIKSLHKLMVTSAAYKQRSSVDNAASTQAAAQNSESIDRSNTLLWRANARKLDSDALRDAVLATSGSLDLTAGGPGWQDFVIEQPEHSPHYRYDLADPNDPRTFRRSVYRFVVRSQMQPFMTALDCADPSMRVDKRNESLSPNQALAYLNNGFMLAQAQRFADRVEREVTASDAAGDTASNAARITHAFRLALGRAPTADESQRLVAFTEKHGLANACRVILNLNEFSFID